VDEQRLASVLVEFARNLTGDFPIQAILDHLVDRVVEVIPVDGAGVLLMDSDTEHHFVAASDDVVRGIETLQMELQQGPCLDAYRTGEHVAVRDLAVDTRFDKFSPAAAAAGLGAVFSFPLRLDDRQLGALELYAKEPTELSAADLEGAQTLADVAAAYLFNASARQEASEQARTSAELAATLQESLIPPELPEVPGMEIGVRWLPGRGGTRVAGDFYDVFPLPGKRWGTLIGDVVGHGARAATLATLARYTVRTLAVLQASPRRVLDGLNDAVLRWGEPEQFLTAVYLTTRMTSQGMEVRLARGGHPAPLIRRADGSVEVLEPPGALLGCIPDGGLKETRFLLAHGDLLFLYSDGVTEARHGLDLFGDERLTRLVASSDPVPGTVVDAVVNQVLVHCHNDPEDDVTALALRAL
jgi:serine phosphatase RsbU (regulator of sigma subunit)